MDTFMEPNKGVGDILYKDGGPYIIQKVLENGVYMCEPFCDDTPSPLDDSGKNQNPRVNDDDDHVEPAKSKKLPKQKSTSKVKKNYTKFSREAELDLIKHYMVERPRRGQDKAKWTKIASLLTINVTHLACQRHLELIIKNRRKYNDKEDVTSGEDPPEPSPFEEQLDKCVQIWTDVHEEIDENVKEIGKSIRDSAVTTMSQSTSPTSDSASQSPKLDIRRELIKVMSKNEARQEKDQELLAQTLDIKRKKLELDAESKKQDREIQLKQISLREKELQLEEQKLALAAKKFELESDITKEKAKEEAQERRLLINMLLQQKNVFMYTLAISWGYNYCVE